MKQFIDNIRQTTTRKKKNSKIVLQSMFFSEKCKIQKEIQKCQLPIS